jgi:hypothetical protein
MVAEARHSAAERQADRPTTPPGRRRGNWRYTEPVSFHRAGSEEDLKMRLSWKSLTLSLVLLLSGGIVGAAELAGVALPDSVTVGQTELVLNGLGLREASMLKVDVYVAGLYLEQKSSDPGAILASDQIKHLHMDFVYKKVATKKITKAWEDGIEANVPDQAASLAAPLAQLNGWMEEMVRGDTMSFTSIPGKGLEVVVKEQRKGLIEDPAFAAAFWSIFLGPEPPNEGLKTGLLGLE